MDVAGSSFPWWHVQQETFWAPPKFVLLICATISTMRRAVFFSCVSTTQSTSSLPAPGWQSAQSKPSAAEITPMLPMKSSTLSSLRVLVVTFLNASPAFLLPAVVAIWPAPPRACADGRTAHTNPLSHTQTNPATASRHLTLIFDPPNTLTSDADQNTPVSF